MANNIKYYNSRMQELDHQGIIKAIKIANENFKRGNVFNCRKILAEVVAAIDRCEEDRNGKDK